MSFFDLIKQRESCRNYIDKEVDKELLVKCIEAARLAPSACNGQPWNFVVITNKELRGKLVKYTQLFTERSGGFIVILEEKPKFQTKLVNSIKKQDYTQMDIGIAASYICLEATELGLSTCMLGWFNENKVKELLNISKSKRVRLIISIGYTEAKKSNKKSRKDIDKILTYIN